MDAWMDGCLEGRIDVRTNMGLQCCMGVKRMDGLPPDAPGAIIVFGEGVAETSSFQETVVKILAGFTDEHPGHSTKIKQGLSGLSEASVGRSGGRTCGAAGVKWSAAWSAGTVCGYSLRVVCG